MEKKFDKDTALAKISARIGNFYERVGRELISEVEIEKQNLIDDIDDVLNQTEISVKHLVIEKLEVDNEIKESLKDKWTN